MPPAVEVPQGFPQPTTEYVKMSPMHRIQATTANNDEPLWTQYMSDCISVATYNTETRLRSLCHLPGGQYDGVIGQLVDIIDDNTVVIFTNGSSGDRGFLESSKDNISKEIQDQHDANGKEGGVYRTYYTDPSHDASHGLTAGTFLIQSDGRYGRIQAQQTQAQGQTSSRGMNVEDGRKSRGTKQGKAGNGGFWRKMFCCGTKRRKTGKSGFWRKMFCCCSC